MIVTVDCTVHGVSCAGKFKLGDASFHTDPALGKSHFHNVTDSYSLLAEPEKRDGKMG
jgi:hypothetical protein